MPLNSFETIRGIKLIVKEYINITIRLVYLSMADIDLTTKSLRLVWISRLLQFGALNWCIFPRYFFDKCGGLSFLPRCNYDPKYLEGVPKFCKETKTRKNRYIDWRKTCLLS